MTNGSQGATLFARNSIVSACILVALLITFMALLYTYEQEKSAIQQRYTSYLLADELRQSSDDLTRLGRTFVVTRNPEYEREYMQILDIRGGKAPRPEKYHHIYWDFVAVNGQAPRPDTTQTADLIDLMRANGFTDGEIEKLNEARKNSDALVNIEVEAMGIVKKNPSDAEAARAISMMHDARYHSEKAKIMRPIDEFYQLMEARIESNIQHSTRISQGVSIVFGILCCALFIMLWRTYRSLNFVIGGSVETLHQNLQSMANGNFAFRIEQNGNPHSLMTSLADVQSHLGKLILKLRSAIEELDQQTQNISTVVSTAKQTADNQATATSSMAASLEQLVVSINNASENTEATQAVAQTTETTLDHSGKIIRNTVSSIEEIATGVRNTADRLGELEEHTQQIDLIVNVIKEIADQTNLLALNAAIEAARAGEQGRGFAVVADEVRKLAERTTRSTQEIAQTIGKIRSSTEMSVQSMNAGVSSVSEGVQMANQAGDALQEIRSSSEQIIGSINDIGFMLKEQATAANHVAANVEKISQQADISNRQASDVLSSVEALQQLTQELAQDIGRFKFEN